MSLAGSPFQKTSNLIGKLIRGTGQLIDNVGIKIQGKYARIDKCKWTIPYPFFVNLQAYHFKVSRHKRLLNVYDKTPVLDKGVFVAPSVSIVGNVHLKDRSSVWYGAVLRGR